MSRIIKYSVVFHTILLLNDHGFDKLVSFSGTKLGRPMLYILKQPEVGGAGKSTLEKLLFNSKDKYDDLQRSEVYEIKCKDCEC
jgi:hypothetical protein